MGLGSVFAARDFDQVVAELRLDRPVDFIEFFAKDDLVKFLDHSSRAEFAERSTRFARWAGRKLSGDGSEVFSRFDLLFQVLTDFLGFYQNVSRGRLGHDLICLY